jgi:hypothetical protein
VTLPFWGGATVADLLPRAESVALAQHAIVGLVP